MTHESIPYTDSSVEVNGAEPTASSTADDVVLLNSVKFSVQCHHIVTAFKGISFIIISVNVLE